MVKQIKARKRLYRVEKRKLPDGQFYDVAVNMYGDYIGDLKTARTLCDKRGIAPEKATPNSKVCSVGFCERENKYYGWSHRAMYGFGVGSKLGPGDSGYTPDTVEGLAREHLLWRMPTDLGEGSRTGNGMLKVKVPAMYVTPDRKMLLVEDGDTMATVIQQQGETPEDMMDRILRKYLVTRDMTSEDKRRLNLYRTGKGEWTAKTLDDARQMAVDFAEDVAAVENGTGGLETASTAAERFSGTYIEFNNWVGQHRNWLARQTGDRSLDM